MRTAELARNPAPNPSAANEAASPDLLSALTGKQAGRDRAVAENTRRVRSWPPSASSRIRRPAAAARGLSPWPPWCWPSLHLGPSSGAWRKTSLAASAFGDIATQTSLWACILYPVILAAVLVAAWPRNKP